MVQSKVLCHYLLHFLLRASSHTLNITTAILPFNEKKIVRGNHHRRKKERQADLLSGKRQKIVNSSPKSVYFHTPSCHSYFFMASSKKSCITPFTHPERKCFTSMTNRIFESRKFAGGTSKFILSSPVPFQFFLLDRKKN